MDDQAPPPYAPSNPHTAMPPITSSASTLTESSTQPFLRGGYVRYEPTLASAAGYFEGRQCTIQQPEFVLRHSLNLIPCMTRNDLTFPQPEDRYRARDVSEVDWNTFTGYLLPTAHEETNEAKHSAREENAEEEKRYAIVVAEWNEGFFGQRGIWLRYEPASLPSASRAIPPQSMFYGAPPSYSHTQHGGASHDDHRDEGGRPHRVTLSKPRSSSTSSSSSSSSSSSEESIASIASRDLDGLSKTQVLQPLNSFRQNAGVNLAAAVAQLRAELRSQPRFLGSGYSRREAKLQRQGLHREIKGEIRALQYSRRDAKRAWKQERRAVKRERKQAKNQLKRENKAAWREEKQKYKAVRREAKQERKMAKRAKKMERKAGDRFERALNPPTAFQGQQTGVLLGEEPGLRPLRGVDDKAGNEDRCRR